jgi:flagellar hook-basal body complex protein FliE
MKMKQNPTAIPDVAMPEEKEYVTVSFERKGFIERTLRETNSSFDRTLHQATADVSSLRLETGKAARKMAEGETVNTHDMMAAVEKARTSYDQLVEIRNKMLEAFREILRERT